MVICDSNQIIETKERTLLSPGITPLQVDTESIIFSPSGTHFMMIFPIKVIGQGWKTSLANSLSLLKKTIVSQIHQIKSVL